MDQESLLRGVQNIDSSFLSWCITQFWHWIVTTKSIDLVPIWLVVSIIFIRYNFPRYFRKSKRISKIETFIRQSKLGDWSVDVNMFLSRGGREERISESSRLIIQSWVWKGIQPIPMQLRAKLFLARNQSPSIDQHRFYQYEIKHWAGNKTLSRK